MAQHSCEKVLSVLSLITVSIFMALLTSELWSLSSSVPIQAPMHVMKDSLRYDAWYWTQFSTWYPGCDDNTIPLPDDDALGWNVTTILSSSFSSGGHLHGREDNAAVIDCNDDSWWQPPFHDRGWCCFDNDGGGSRYRAIRWFANESRVTGSVGAFTIWSPMAVKMSDFTSEHRCQEEYHPDQDCARHSPQKACWWEPTSATATSKCVENTVAFHEQEAAKHTATVWCADGKCEKEPFELVVKWTMAYCALICSILFALRSIYTFYTCNNNHNIPHQQPLLSPA
jgi:hypothetical protein